MEWRSTVSSSIYKNYRALLELPNRSLLRSVNNLHPYHQDQDSARPHKRHKNRDSRPSSSQRESDRPHVSAPFVNMTSFPSQHHRNSSPRSSSPPSASPAPPPPSSPSPSYLELSKTPLETISSPSTSRKLLILDLNGTLVLRSPRPQGKTTYNSQQRPAPRAVYPRPYMGVFREWMFHKVNREWLDVMVWSSAQPHSVNDMVQQAFGEEGKMLKAIWARDKMGLGADVYRESPMTIHFPICVLLLHVGWFAIYGAFPRPWVRLRRLHFSSGLSFHRLETHSQIVLAWANRVGGLG